MSLFQELKRVLDLANVKVEDLREHSGVELQTLNARRLQQSPMIFADSADLPHDHAANGIRERALNFGHRAS
jgi:hypothetical protein